MVGMFLKFNQPELGLFTANVKETTVKSIGNKDQCKYNQYVFLLIFMGNTKTTTIQST